MKKMISLLFCILLSFAAMAQQMGAPKYDDIKKVVSDPKSAFYYPELLQRYQQGDSTFTIDECRHLYFGYVFQPEWNPYGLRNSETKYLMQLSMPDNLDTALAAIAKAENILKNDPFNIDVLMIAFYLASSDLVNNREKAESFNNRIGIVLNAISSCGSGQSPEDAFYVISISHEYTILSLLGFQLKSQSLSGGCDVMELQENDYDIEKLYFNVSKILEKESELFGGGPKKSKKEKNQKSNK
ncbi:MAG: DUF4919 domain-containing protein [Bacteroidales bacterium]|nr:DUF4919 domain-containing protein [Bacteroidales bacterium]